MIAYLSYFWDNIEVYAKSAEFTRGNVKIYAIFQAFQRKVNLRFVGLFRFFVGNAALSVPQGFCHLDGGKILPEFDAFSEIREQNLPIEVKFCCGTLRAAFPTHKFEQPAKSAFAQMFFSGIRGENGGKDNPKKILMFYRDNGQRKFIISVYNDDEL